MSVKMSISSQKNKILKYQKNKFFKPYLYKIGQRQRNENSSIESGSKISSIQFFFKVKFWAYSKKHVRSSKNLLWPLYQLPSTALYLLGVSQVTKFMNFNIKIFFVNLIHYCKSKCCAKIQLSISIASHRNNYLKNIFLYRVL